MSSIGRLFRVTTFGESHGIGVGCIIEGIPPCFKLNTNDIQYQLDRRKPNQNSLMSPRSEPDIVEIYSGLENEVTLGTPICLIVKNIDMKQMDYKSFSNIPRPGHADLTYLTKYGVKSSSGGGRASARETVARVCAGAVAECFLFEKEGIEIVSWVNSIGDIEIPKELRKSLYTCPISKKEVDLMGSFILYKSEKGDLIYQNVYDNKYYTYNIEKIVFEIIVDKLENNAIYYNDGEYNFFENINVRCPHIETAIAMINRIKEIKSENDSIGGTVSCVIKNVPQSLGEPCFDKIEADLAKAMLSIPATKGFEIGSGFEGTKLKGSEHNDIFEKDLENKLNKHLSLLTTDIKTKTNNAGGILGGITTGENIYFKIAIKPVSTIGKEQSTVDYDSNDQTLTAKGRHDPCVLPRAMPIVEGMAAIIIMDHYLIQASRKFTYHENYDNN